MMVNQARRQDSVTGGAEINFGGHEKFTLCEFERGTGARERDSNEQGEEQRSEGIFRPKLGTETVFPAENR